jgi:hypothetical protein
MREAAETMSSSSVACGKHPKAAESPSMTIAREKIHAICVCFQSSGVDLFTLSSCVSGILKTLKA